MTLPPERSAGRTLRQVFSPAVQDRIAYAGGHSGVIAYAADDGTERWTTPIAGAIRPVTIAGGVVYVPADTERRLYAVDAATGHELWQLDLDGALGCCVSVADGMAFVATGQGTLYAIGGTGTAPASLPIVTSSPAPAPASPSATGIDGTWHTDPLTEDQIATAFAHAGGTLADGRDFFHAFGVDPTTHVTIIEQFDQGSLTESGMGDSGVPVIGSRATYDIADDGTVTLREGACTQTFSHEVDADTSRLHHHRAVPGRWRLQHHSAGQLPVPPGSRSGPFASPVATMSLHGGSLPAVEQLMREWTRRSRRRSRRR